ncbi:MAG: sigma-70 family RNA polymerase sigma factor [Rubrivivax sp.]|nr:sigma-70 family RNA polymerase sigma factor [Rubrivivax sp.]
MEAAAPAFTATAATAATAIAAVPAAGTPGWPALVAERSALVRFARRRLLDASLAEDLVHDVFEAVASGRARFDGRATVRTWLTAILKHKIVDLVRSRSGHESLDGWAGDAEADDGAPAPELVCPQPRPDEVAAQREHLAQVLERVRALPDTLRQAFEQRVLADEDSADVCRTLGISENNLFVRLHRARAALAAAA